MRWRRAATAAVLGRLPDILGLLPASRHAARVEFRMSSVQVRRSGPRGRASESEAVALARPFVKQLERWHARVAYLAALANSGRNASARLVDVVAELDGIAAEVEQRLGDLKSSLGPLVETSRGIDRVTAMQRLLDLVSRTRRNLGDRLAKAR